jgi:hypothetical protein
MSGPAFFTFALANLEATERSMALSVRTLPDDRLAGEIDQLHGLAGTTFAADLMLKIYQQEAARRASPEHAFDDHLDKALFRLERQTSPDDRQSVLEIGRRLYRIGGKPALERARDRMLALATDGKRDLRAAILAKRWPPLR